MIGWLLCRLFGKHQRSIALAFKNDEGVVRSRCQHCGVRMQRDERRRWRAVEESTGDR